MSRLPRRGGLASFGHENSAPLVAQNHPPSIDPYSVFSSRLHKKRERERDISRGMADRYVNNLIFACEKKKGEKEWRETLLGLRETCFNSRHVSKGDCNRKEMKNSFFRLFYLGKGCEIFGGIRSKGHLAAIRYISGLANNAGKQFSGRSSGRGGPRKLS